MARPPFVHRAWLVEPALGEAEKALRLAVESFDGVDNVGQRNPPRGKGEHESPVPAPDAADQRALGEGRQQPLEVLLRDPEFPVQDERGVRLPRRARQGSHHAKRVFRRPGELHSTLSQRQPPWPKAGSAAR